MYLLRQKIIYFIFIIVIENMIEIFFYLFLSRINLLIIKISSHRKFVYFCQNISIVYIVIFHDEYY